MTAKQEFTSLRELIGPHPGDKRFVRRHADRTLGSTVDVGKSLSVDNRSHAMRNVPKGQGNRGDTT